MQWVTVNLKIKPESNDFLPKERGKNYKSPMQEFIILRLQALSMELIKNTLYNEGLRLTGTSILYITYLTNVPFHKK